LHNRKRQHTGKGRLGKRKSQTVADIEGIAQGVTGRGERKALSYANTNYYHLMRKKGNSVLKLHVRYRNFS